MKKILLAAINARYTHSCLALYSLKSCARAAGRDVAVREFSINQEVETIAAAIASEHPDAIGFSVYIWNVELIKRIIPATRERCRAAVILLGGPEVSYNPESWLASFPYLDYIIIGLGEGGFLRLLEHDFSLDEKIIAVPAPPLADLPCPYAEDDFPALLNRYVYYESSRGCPFRCSYCLSSRGDQRLETKNTETIMKEMAFILSHEPMLLKFVDRTFNAQKHHYRDVWRLIIEQYRNGPTSFHFEIHPGLLDDDDFSILSECPEGLFQFEIGVQSTNPATQSAIRRNGDWTREKPIIERLIALRNIRVHIDCIVGLPFDDLASIARTFNDIYNLQPDYFQVGLLKVLPGTEMTERADEYGIEYGTTAPYRVIQNRWLAREEIELLDNISLLVDRLFNTRRFAVTLSVLSLRYTSPFDLYRELASRLDDTAPLTRSWEQCAKFLLNAADSLFPGDNRYFLDTVRWDWCSASQNQRRYPSFINPRGAASTTKSGIAYFKSLAKNDIIRHKDAVFRSSHLNGSIFFEAESEEFRRGYMNNEGYALFLPDKKIVFYTV
ncbi:MAG: DUF4080 domain-containing protein [Spirochaetes bacterium]|nr:DUF4080 domain-containing protein [Spirochaetota bacterium]